MADLFIMARGAGEVDILNQTYVRVGISTPPSLNWQSSFLTTTLSTLPHTHAPYEPWLSCKWMYWLYSVNFSNGRTGYLPL